METLTKNLTEEVKSSISRALDTSMTYLEYRELVHQLATQGSNSGPEKTDAFANYTQLNDSRMKRWDKTLKMDPEIISKLQGMTANVTWLVLTESWCGDASPSLPVMNKFSNIAPNIKLRIALRDEHPELMDAFLTNGARSIPKLIALDTTTQNVLWEWGPRSSKATKMVMDFKVVHGQLTAEFKKELQQFYNKDKGQDIANDLARLLALE